MDAEKVNKAAILAAASYDNPFDEPAYDKRFYDGFMACAKWLMQQPLAERLTEEEKKKIKAKYNELKSLNSITNDMFADDAAILEWLFGKELFNKK